MRDLEEKLKQAIIQTIKAHHKETGELCRELDAHFKFESPIDGNCDYKCAVNAYDARIDNLTPLEYIMSE